MVLTWIIKSNPSWISVVLSLCSAHILVFSSANYSSINLSRLSTLSLQLRICPPGSNFFVEPRPGNSLRIVARAIIEFPSLVSHILGLWIFVAWYSLSCQPFFFMFVLGKWVNLVFVMSSWLEVEILKFYNFIIFKTFAYICIMPFIYLKCLHLTTFYSHPILIHTIHDQGRHVLLFLAHVLPSTEWIRSIKL